MGTSINTNLASLGVQRYLNSSQNSVTNAMTRLSTGLRINSAKDDAAGLLISERMTTQIRGMNVAARNANDAISLAQTAEGALGTMTENLQRIRELAVQAANGNNSASDRAALQREVAQMVSQVDLVASTTEFGGKKLFDGTFGMQNFQIGANANQTISAAMVNARTNAFGNNSATGKGIAAVPAAASVTSNGIAAAATITTTVSGPAGTTQVSVAANATAAKVAADINTKSGTTGVKASATTQAQLSFAAAGTYTLKLRSDNATDQDISFNLSATNTAEGLSAALTAINAQSSKTGVTASLNETQDKIVLTNSTGNDISIGKGAVTTPGVVTIEKLNASSGVVTPAATLAVDDTSALNSVVSGYVTLESEGTFSVTDSVAGGYFSETSEASTLESVNTVDVTSFANATKAIKITDAALSFVNTERSKLGALQSRFESTVLALDTISEHTTAARGRLMDADFAKETAALSRAQILQQAGTAMLAQANALPQQVLQLLKG